MNPIDALFQSLRAAKKKAFIPFLPAGDPDLAFTAEAMAAVTDAGASLIEVGFPFSDPVADGPVIQASYTRALAGGLKLDHLFDAMKPVPTATPRVAMASYSLIFRKGPEAFVTAAQAAGFSGFVVPDLPVEEADDLSAICRDRDMGLTLLVTPTTSPERAAKIVAACRGFVYVVSVVGITGTRDRLPVSLHDMMIRLRSLTDLPLCIGFGVSTPEHVRELAPLADGVIVGSALVRILERAGNPGQRAACLTEIRTTAASLAAALG